MKGRHGLQGGRSLSQLIEIHLDIKNRLNCPDLSESIIEKWALEYIAKHKKRPSGDSSDVVNPSLEKEWQGITWCAINNALRRGNRGLRKYKSLSEFLNIKLGKIKRNKYAMVSNTIIIDWIKQFKIKYRRNPKLMDGKIEFADGQYFGMSWRSINECLRNGYRGLIGGSSLKEIVSKNGT
jgi:hypothetical protein